jgi:hypothetical protein
MASPAGATPPATDPVASPSSPPPPAADSAPSPASGTGPVAVASSAPAPSTVTAPPAAQKRAPRASAPSSVAPWAQIVRSGSIKSVEGAGDGLAALVKPSTPGGVITSAAAGKAGILARTSSGATDKGDNGKEAAGKKGKAGNAEKEVAAVDKGTEKVAPLAPASSPAVRGYAAAAAKKAAPPTEAAAAPAPVEAKGVPSWTGEKLAALEAREGHKGGRGSGGGRGGGRGQAPGAGVRRNQEKPVGKPGQGQAAKGRSSTGEERGGGNAGPSRQAKPLAKERAAEGPVVKGAVTPAAKAPSKEQKGEKEESVSGTAEAGGNEKETEIATPSPEVAGSSASAGEAQKEGGGEVGRITEKEAPGKDEEAEGSGDTVERASTAGANEEAEASGEEVDAAPVAPAKPAWKKAQAAEAAAVPTVGPVMGAVSWPTLGDAKSKDAGKEKVEGQQPGRPKGEQVRHRTASIWRCGRSWF